MRERVLCVAFLVGLVTGQVEVGLLRGSDFSTTLTYLHGNCSWILTVVLLGRVQELPLDEGPKTLLEGTGLDNMGDDVILKCTGPTDGIVKLQTVIKFYDVTEIPSPKNIQINGTYLRWNHVLHSSDLPSGFKLTTNFNISYWMTVVDINSERNGKTLILYETSLDISHVLDYCRRQEFTIQTVVNDLYRSQNSSYSTNPTTPVIFGASLLLVEDNYAVVQVLFHLEVGQCISQFHIIIDGLVDISFNVTSSDRERGEVTYDLSPYISPDDVCNVRGVVYGSNGIGDSSTQVQLQPPGDCHPHPSVVVSSWSTGYSSSTTTGDQPTPVPTTPTDVSLLVAPLVLAVLTLAVAISPTVVIAVFITRKLKYTGKGSDVTGDVSLQTNEAYCTVTTGVPMKRNEAYESVLRTETDSPNTQHTYETVH